MAVPNTPITTEQSLGDGAMLAGIFTKAMFPGLQLALYFFIFFHAAVGNKYEYSLPPTAAVVIGYWLYVGNDDQKAWANLSKHPQNDYNQVYIGSRKNISVIKR
jgi:hypothetical protein